MDKHMIIPECLTQKGKLKEQKRKRVIRGIAGVLMALGLGTTVVKTVVFCK